MPYFGFPLTTVVPLSSKRFSTKMQSPKLVCRRCKVNLKSSILCVYTWCTGTAMPSPPANCKRWIQWNAEIFRVGLQSLYVYIGISYIYVYICMYMYIHEYTLNIYIYVHYGDYIEYIFLKVEFNEMSKS